MRLWKSVRDVHFEPAEQNVERPTKMIMDKEKQNEMVFNEWARQSTFGGAAALAHTLSPLGKSLWNPIR